MRFPLILVLSLVLWTVSTAQTTSTQASLATSDVVEDVYLARDDGEGKAGDVASVFRPTDIPVHCIVVLTSPDPTAVRMNFVAVKVAGVKPESRVVSASYATQQGQDRVFFTGRPHGKWTVGEYRIDVFVNDKLEKSVTFEVKGIGAVPAASSFAPTTPRPTMTRKKN